MVRDDILTVLEADGTLDGLLTGGMYAGGEITRQATPAAFDANGELLPCLLVNMETDVPSGPHHYSSYQYVRVFFYQRTGYSTIDSALSRVYALLHKQKIGSSTWEILHTDDILDREDQALGCSLHMSRYQVVISKA